jgi:hypothetical protein
MLLGRAPERRQCAGRFAGLAAPCATLREPRPPRRPCGLAPHHLEVRAIGPLRACHPWNASRIFVPRRTRSEMSSGKSPVSCARKARWPSYRGIEAGVPLLRLAFEGRASASIAQATAHAGGPACAPQRDAAPPARAPPASTFSQPPRPYNLPVPPLPLPRPEVRRSTARSDRAPWTPPAGQLPAPLRPSAATNRLWVSPSSFPAPSPAEPATGAVQFRLEPPPPWPRDYIGLFHYFQGVFREPGTYL